MVSHPRMPPEEQPAKDAPEKNRRISALSFYGYLARYRAVYHPSLLALFVTEGLSLAFPYYLSKLIGIPAGSFAEALQASDTLDVESVSAAVRRAAAKDPPAFD